MSNLIRPIDMLPGRKYEVRTRIQGVQRYDRKHVMVYLGVKDTYNEFLFSARPTGGSQAIRFENVISVKEVHPNTPCYLNARA